MRKLHFFIIAFCCLTFSSFATVKPGPGKEYTFKVSAADLHLKTNNKQTTCDYTIHVQFENVGSPQYGQLYKYWITLNTDNSIYPAPASGSINITATYGSSSYSTTLNFQQGISVHWAAGPTPTSAIVTSVYINSFYPTSYGGYYGCMESTTIYTSSNLVTTQPYFDSNPPL
ncbi:MAG: hypothetical protein EOP47_27600 [Sphingobacteriaceae bacterium]|nr:MAG: hypothetical protein EOP47_27600 [Sphingobacteriaceae bacterium]